MSGGTTALDDAAALIPAAGSGARLGRGPKAFVRVDGRTLLEHAASVVARVAGRLVVAVPPGREDDARALLPDAIVIAGGASRQRTVSLLIEACEARWLLVHDAARPLTPPSVAASVLAAAREHGAATAALRVADTLHDVANDAPVARDGLRLVQTPQAFARDVLVAAHDRAVRLGIDATDDAQLVRAAGGRVALVPGSLWAHKLTDPDDAAWLEMLASARHEPTVPS